VEALYERYTQNDEGGISTAEELSQMTTNLIFKINLHVPDAKASIDRKVKSAVLLEPWRLEQFEDWFYEEFGFSNEEVTPNGSSANHEAENVPLMDSTADDSIKPHSPGSSSPPPSSDCFALKVNGASSIGQGKIGSESTTRVIAPVVHEDPGKKDVVAFEMVENLCFETDKISKVGLVRRGALKGKITVGWKTENINIMKESYIDQQGTATFEHGINKASIDIEILDNDEWNLEALCKILLVLPPDADFDLGELRVTTMVILNEDPFPHGETNQNDALKMVSAFIKHLYHDLNSEAKTGALLKIYPAFQWLINTMMVYFALNYAVKINKDGTPKMDQTSGRILLTVLGVAFIIGVGLWHFFLDKFENLKLGGKARMLLRRALVSTMVQLTSSESARFPSGECLSIMSEQVENSTAVCWTGMMNVWAQLVRLVVMTILTITLVVQKVPQILPIPFLMMAIDFYVLTKRVDKQVELFGTFMDIDNTWKAMVIEMSELRGLITAYRAGYSLECDFAGLNKNSNAARFTAQKYQNNTQKILKWNHAIWIFACFVYGGMSASPGIDDDGKAVMGIIDAGAYVTLIGTMNSYDAVISNLFDSLFNCVNGFVSVQKIATLLNANTRRKALLAAKERRKRVLAEILESDPSFDFDPGCISVYNVAYDYALDAKQEGEEETEKKSYVVDTQVGPFTMVVDQGQIICVQAGSSSGKKTFIQLLGRILLPNVSGLVIYPDNLRVRYIPGEPLVFDASLMDNLRFGLRTTGKTPDDEEIWDLCRLLGLSNELIGAGDFQVGGKGLKLSLSDRITINLARALISSVDLLLLANSLDLLGIEDAVRIIGIIRVWIADRGMKCLKHDFPEGVPTALLKKKSFFYCSKNAALEKEADAVLNLKRSGKQ